MTIERMTAEEICTDAGMENPDHQFFNSLSSALTLLDNPEIANGILYYWRLKGRVKRIEICRREFEAGDTASIMDALNCCVLSPELATPNWLSKALLGAFDQRHDIKSWNDVLGKPIKGHRDSAKNDEELRSFVYAAVERERLRENPLKRLRKNALDNDLYEEVGEIFGKHKTKIGELHREERENLEGGKMYTAEGLRII